MQTIVIDIDGKLYIEKSTDDIPFGNACNHCDVRDMMECYTRRDFSCHSDSRPDGKDVVFILVEG